MKRADLYALVWEQPVTHVAKEFGVSDVAIRKICIKHGIPTPPLGYWAKLQHGKRVTQPPLPPLKSGQSDSVNLHARLKPSLPTEVLETRRIVEQELTRPENRISVPTERPVKLHPLAFASEKILRKVKPDDEGFVVCGGAGKLDVKIGSASIDRVVVLIHAMLNAATEKGYQLSSNAEFRIVVDEQPLAVRIYETKTKAEHVPTPVDLKQQAREDETRLRYNITYKSTRNVYPAWDYSPSGRLVLEISDPKQAPWQGDPIVGRWRDRSTKRLEDYLSEMLSALKVGGAIARHQRAKEAEEARIAKEAEENRREQDRQRRLLEKVTKFLLEKADKHGQLVKLENLAAYLETNSTDSKLDKNGELSRAIEFVLVNLRSRLTAESISLEIIQTRLLEPDRW